MTIKRPLAALAFALVLACQNGAQAETTECHDSQDFRVAAQAYAEDAGQKFAVTALSGRPAPKDCSFNDKSADFVFGAPGEPLWFERLAGHHLILRRSTGPQGDLVVVDLKARRTVLDVGADEYDLSGTALGYWQRSDEEANAANCPELADHQANGLGSVIASQAIYDLGTGKTTMTGQKRCDATQ